MWISVRMVLRKQFLLSQELNYFIFIYKMMQSDFSLFVV